MCCRHCWFSSVAYEPTKGAVVLHCVPSCKTRINRQECRGTLLPCAPVHFHCLSAVCSLFTGTREAKQTCQHFKGSFTEQGQVSQSPLHKYNPLQETAQCSCQCCYLFLCGAIWMELSLADLAQARRKNTQKTHKRLQTPWGHSCFDTVLLSRRSSLSWVKFLTLLSGIFRCSVVTPAVHVGVSVCTCEEGGRQLPSRSHLQLQRNCGSFCEWAAWRTNMAMLMLHDCWCS